MKASLLPADLKSEIGQLPKEVKSKGQQSKSLAIQERNFINDKLLVQKFSEQASRLKSASEQFIEISKTDLKICLPKNETPCRLMEIGDEINSINTKITTWKQVNMEFSNYVKLHSLYFKILFRVWIPC